MSKLKPILVVVAAVAMAFARASIGAEDETATTFSYTDPKASSVGVAGEFNNWSISPMSKDDSGKWTKTLHVKPGQYGYKFVVDGQWMLDPTNPARKKVNDIENSAVSVGTPPVAASTSQGGETVSFTYVNTTAKTVHVAGEFNRWLDNVDGKVSGHNEWLMQNDGGIWKLTTKVPAGKYKFKYVIDGGTTWEQDTAMPVSTDGNSIVEVKAGAAPDATSATTPTPAVSEKGGSTFTYAESSAKAVAVAGEFNQWSATANPMQKDASGLWTTTIPIKPGRYQYKFVVDGNWKQDPACAETVDDGFGGKNSVKTVTQ